MTNLPAPNVSVPVTVWRGNMQAGERCLPDEAAVALTYDRVTFAVMMASPLDLHDFAVGFSISEGVIKAIADITDIEIAVLPAGVECRMTLVASRRAALERRRRWIAGPAGCGLCGIDSLAEATRPVPQVTSRLTVSAVEINAAMARLPALQILNQESRAVHAAAFFAPANGEIVLREDVGRHNALDKLIGALRRRGDDSSAGVLLLTSRVSIELIQKTAMLGAGIVVAVSVPSARAVREAEAAGITLVAVARQDGFEVFTHPWRIAGL